MVKTSVLTQTQAYILDGGPYLKSCALDEWVNLVDRDLLLNNELYSIK